MFASSPLLLLSQSRPASTPKESKPVSTPKPALNNNPVSAPKPVGGAVNFSSPKPVSNSESFSNPKPTNASTPVSSPKAVSRFNGESGVFIPVWEKEMQVSSPVNVQEMIKAPFFTGASFDREVVNLPYFDMLVPVGKGESLTIGSVQAEGVQEVSDETFKLAMQSATLQGRCLVSQFPCGHRAGDQHPWRGISACTDLSDPRGCRWEQLQEGIHR
ncbi:MAG: hypothetical protein IPP17_30760 [Bacteroidetes bacterium]|nr:hypothetical protein [Bacteroidota bacterium]